MKKQKPAHPVKLEVETTGVTDGLALGVAPPERRCVGPAVGADHPRPPVPALQCHESYKAVDHPMSLTLLLDTLVLAGGLLTVVPPVAPPPVLGLIPFILL